MTPAEQDSLLNRPYGDMPVPQIPVEPPPTVESLLANTDPFVVYNFFDVMNRQPRYESKLYGVIAAILANIFPTHRSFVVEGESPLPEAVPHDFSGDISISSEGGHFPSRYGSA